jgi:hypothetical protein
MGDILLTLLFFSEACDRARSAWDAGRTGEKFEALKMVHHCLHYSWPKKLDAQDRQSYTCAMAEVRKCGDNSRPSRDEVAVLACTMLDIMWQEDQSVREKRLSRGDIFPVSQPLGQMKIFDAP